MGSPAPVPPTAPTPSHWEIRTTPYLWLASTHIDASAGGTQVTATISALDLLKALQFGFMNVFEVRHDRVMFVMDSFFARVQDDATVGPFSASLGPATIHQPRADLHIPRIDVPIGPINTDVTANLFYLDTKLGYRILSHDLSPPGLGPDSLERREFIVDLLAGDRYWHLKNRIDVKIPPIQVPGFKIQPSFPAFPDLMLPGIHVKGVTLAGLDKTFEATTDWVDPLLGARVRLDLPHKFFVTAIGDVGGFGIGSASDVTWQGAGLVGYKMSPRWTSVIGYRTLGLTRNGAEITMFGPLMGMSFKF